jgi:hypothetical protein
MFFGLSFFMEFEKREVLVGISVFIVAVGAGMVIGDVFSQPQQSELYSSDFNLTLDSDNQEERVEFDNRSVNITYENWNEFRAYIENGDKQWELNTTSNGERRTLSKIIVLGDEAYSLSFRYRDNPEEFDGDFLQLYRIKQIQ